LTQAKADILGNTFSDMDVLVLQGTHVPGRETSRLKTNSFDLIHHIGHKKHGLATHLNQNKSFTNVDL